MTTESGASDKAIDEQYDDAALFEVACYLLEKTGQTQDPRIAAITESCIEVCKADPQVIAKLLVELNKYHKQATQEPFNPFAPPVQRNMAR